MATTEVRTTSTSTETLKKDLRSKSPRRPAGPIIDEEGNVLPYPGYTGNKKDNYGCWSSPIDRLAAAASLDKPEPFAGEYGIEHSKAPQIDIPPECFLYDEDRPWQLGKLNKAALDCPEPAAPIQLPKHVQELLDALEKAANHVFTVQKAAVENGNEASSVDTLAVYEKAKAEALAALATPPKEEKPAQAEPEVAEEVKEAAAPEEAKAAPVRKPVKPKGRNASSSPANKGGKKPASSAKAPNAPASSSAPRVQAQGASRTSTQQVKPKASGKSPGRGDAPPSKLTTATSSRSSTAPKKVANAK